MPDRLQGSRPQPKQGRASRARKVRHGAWRALRAFRPRDRSGLVDRVWSVGFEEGYTCVTLGGHDGATH